jgi:hypothetical protein
VSADAVVSSGYTMTRTDMLVNCPVVPDGSKATLRYPGDTSPTDGVHRWYDGKIVSYFTFGEKQARLTAASRMVPTSPIYVTFNDDASSAIDGGRKVSSCKHCR